MGYLNHSQKKKVNLCDTYAAKAKKKKLTDLEDQPDKTKSRLVAACIFGGYIDDVLLPELLAAADAIDNDLDLKGDEVAETVGEKVTRRFVAEYERNLTPENAVNYGRTLALTWHEKRDPSGPDPISSDDEFEDDADRNAAEEEVDQQRKLHEHRLNRLLLGEPRIVSMEAMEFKARLALHDELCSATMLNMAKEAENADTCDKLRNLVTVLTDMHTEMTALEDESLHQVLSPAVQEEAYVLHWIYTKNASKLRLITRLVNNTRSKLGRVLKAKEPWKSFISDTGKTKTGTNVHGERVKDIMQGLSGTPGANDIRTAIQGLKKYKHLAPGSTNTLEERLLQISNDAYAVKSDNTATSSDLIGAADRAKVIA